MNNGNCIQNYVSNACMEGFEDFAISVFSICFEL